MSHGRWPYRLAISEGGTKDENGKDITNDFEAQVRHTFYIFEQALNKQAGASRILQK